MMDKNRTHDSLRDNELEKKEKILCKIAEINGRRVIRPLFEGGLYQTMEYWGDDAFIGTLDMVIEWEKGYVSYIERMKRNRKNSGKNKKKNRNAESKTDRDKRQAD